MPAGAVNHPPTPVVETATTPGVPPETCEEIKARYGMETGTHRANGSKKSVNYQSHHILQGAATNNLIDYMESICVLLVNSHLGTPHQVTTRRQNERRNNKAGGRPGALPATNFGELKQLAKDDLVDSFTNGSNMPQEDAEKLADCLVAEAEKKVKKDAKSEKKINVTDSTPVLQVGGCLPADTLVWLDNAQLRRVSDLQCGDVLQGLRTSQLLIRFDHCINDLVTLTLLGSTVSMAPFHRVLTAQGRFERADSLRPGQWLQTHRGPQQLQSMAREVTPVPITSFGVGVAFECRVGPMGLWIELPNTGVPVTRNEALHSPVRVSSD